MKTKTVNVDEIAAFFGTILDSLDSDVLLDKCGKAALKVARTYKKPVKSQAASNIKHSPSKGNNRTYVSTFVAKELKDSHGTYGAMIWNKNYRLSHLIESPHLMWNTAKNSSNNYNMFHDNNDPACQEYEKECIKIVMNALKGK